MPGDTPDQNILHLSGCGGDAVKQLQLMEAVHHHTPDALLHRLGQFLWRFVVPVEVDPVQGDPSDTSHRQLPPGDHVQPQTLILEDSGQGRVDVSLGGVDNAGVLVASLELLDEAAAAGAQGSLVQDVDRSAVLASQLQGVAAADDELALGVDLGSIGEHGSMEHYHSLCQ